MRHEELDRREGVDGGHYQRKVVTADAQDGRRIEADTYVAGSRFIITPTQPSQWYLNLILEGATEHGLPVDYIRQIELIARGVS